MRFKNLICLEEDKGTGGGAPPAPFYSNFTDPELKGLAETRKFENPEAVVRSFRDLEKLRGVPADRLLSLPADDKPESMAPIYDRLGRPKTPAEYGVKPPEGAPAEFGEKVSKLFHDMGLSKKQGEGIANFLAETTKAGATATAAANATKMTEQVAGLKKEWGTDAERRCNVVDDFCKALGMTEDQQKAAEGALGWDGFAKLMYGVVEKFDIKLGESQFHGGDGKGGTGFTPAGAEAKRKELLSDPDFYKKWRGGDKASVKQIDDLYKAQFPSGIENALGDAD